jgi:hypothetical protein
MAVGLALFWSGAAAAATLNVPAQYATIQAAINAAVNGDEVVVAPGTYLENINFNGKAITVRSSDGAAVTTIDGQNLGRTVYFVSGESRSSMLEGVRVTNGGVLAQWTQPTVRNCLFEFNVSASYGGAMAVDGTNSSALVEGYTFRQNQALVGAAIWFGGPDCAPVVTGCVFQNNSATARAGAVQVDQPGTTVTMSNCSFSSNSAPNEVAGAVGVWGAQVSMTNCQFSENSAPNGAALELRNGGRVTATTCTFANNTATQGGAIHNCCGGQLTCDQVQFVANSGGNGGAILSADNSSSLSITRCGFRENISRDDGTVLVSWNQAARIRNCQFVGNSIRWGGVIVAREMTNFAVEGCLFAGNQGTDASAGLSAANVGGTSHITNSTFANNAVSNGGGWALACLGSTSLAVANTIFYGNTSYGAPSQIGGDAAPVATYSLVQGGYPGTGNIDADPLFFDPNNGDYRLGAGSPCIDTGSNAAVPPELNTDIDGNPRISDGNNDGVATVDMGAYETVDCNHNGVPDWADIANGTSHDCNANGIPDECDIANGTSQDCNGDGVPDECPLPPGTPDCNMNGVPDVCDIAAGTSEDCNSNGIPDECEVPPIGPASNDLNGNGIPDDCEDHTCTNLTTGQTYSTIAAAIAAAQNGHHLRSAPLAFAITPTIDFLSKQVLLDSSGGIVQPIVGLINITNNADLATAGGQTLTVKGTLRSANAAVADVAAGTFVLNANATLRARLGSTLSIDTTGGSTLDGLTYVEANATLNFSGPVTNIETVTVVANGTFSASDLFTNGAIFNTLNSNVIFTNATNEGGMNLPNVSLLADNLNNAGTGQITGHGQLYTNLTNGGDVIITGNTTLVGDVLNDATGRIYLQIGTTTLIGNLTNHGAVIGNFGLADTAGRLDLLGDFVADAAASLRLAQAGTVFSVTGGYDNAINDAARFDLHVATLQFRGALVPQLVEVMSTDLGPVVAGLDPNGVGHFPLGTLQIGAGAPTTVQLVDLRDNDGLGQGTPEAVYVDTLQIDAGATLDNSTYKVYYNTLVNHGAVTHPDNLVRITTLVPGDLNCDGVVDFGDINPFVLALSDPAGYQAAFPNCDILNGDCSGNGSVDFDDINPFVAILSGGD